MTIDMFAADACLEEGILPFKLPDDPRYGYQWDAQRRVFVIQIPNGELVYCENFFSPRVSDRAQAYFLEHDTPGLNIDDHNQIDPAQVNWRNIPWHQYQMQMYGKQVPLARFNAWHGDSHKPFSYSGMTLKSHDWNKGLLYLKEKVEAIAELRFNSVLMSWYRNGEDYISWHSDTKTEFGVNQVIASVNFGATRRFLLRRTTNPTEKLDIPLKHGTLLIMRGQTQHYWQHSVPKEAKVSHSRFNLTFRVLKYEQS